MKRNVWTIGLVLVLLVLVGAAAAQAATFDTIKGWIGANAVVLLITGLLAIGAVWVWIEPIALVGVSGCALGITFFSIFLDRKVEKQEIQNLKQAYADFRAALDTAKAKIKARNGG